MVFTPELVWGDNVTTKIKSVNNYQLYDKTHSRQSRKFTDVHETNILDIKMG